MSRQLPEEQGIELTTLNSNESVIDMDEEEDQFGDRASSAKGPNPAPSISSTTLADRPTSRTEITNPPTPPRPEVSSSQNSTTTTSTNTTTQSTRLSWMRGQPHSPTPSSSNSASNSTPPTSSPQNTASNSKPTGSSSSEATQPKSTAPAKASTTPEPTGSVSTAGKVGMGVGGLIGAYGLGSGNLELILLGILMAAFSYQFKNKPSKKSSEAKQDAENTAKNSNHSSIGNTLQKGAGYGLMGLGTAAGFAGLIGVADLEIVLLGAVLALAGKILLDKAENNTKEKAKEKAAGPKSEESFGQKASNFAGKAGSTLGSGAMAFSAVGIGLSAGFGVNLGMETPILLAIGVLGLIVKKGGDTLQKSNAAEKAQTERDTSHTARVSI